MKAILKQYWWAIAIITLAPVALNFILQIHVSDQIVGKDIDWLTFWSSYLGAIISSLTAMFVLFKTLKQNHDENEKNRLVNKAENERNRKLQLNILRQQQENLWLDKFRQVALDYIQIYNPNALTRVSFYIKFGKPGVSDLLKEIFDRSTICNNKLNCFYKQDTNATILKRTLNGFMEKHDIVSRDIQEVVLNLLSNSTMSMARINILYQNKVLSKDMIAIVGKVLDNYRYQGNPNILNIYSDMISRRISDIDSLDGEVKKTLFTYIRNEQTRIDKITDEE